MAWFGPLIESLKIVAERLKAKKRLEFGTDVNTTDGSAISVETPFTLVTTAAGETRTLANGYEGQIKIIKAGGTMTGACVITPANMVGALTTATVTAVNDVVAMIFRAGAWEPLFIYGTGAFA